MRGILNRYYKRVFFGKTGMADNESLVTLMAFNSHVSAYILKGKLSSYGIRSFVFFEHHIALNPMWAQALGGIELKVNNYDFKKAQSVLRQIERTEVTTDSGEIVVCPECQSASLSGPFTSMKSDIGIIALLVSFVVTTYPIWNFIVYRCNVCKKEFKRSW